MQSVWPVPKIDFMPLAEIVDKRDVAVVYTQPVWDIVKDKLHLSIVSEAQVTEATVAHWQNLRADVIGDVIYAVGGGLAVDAAKYIAVQKNIELVCIPTVLSVDAFITWASGYREDGCVRYVETKPPEQMIVDFDILASAPETIRAAGLCDVLSIATGCWDWKFAEEQGKNPSNMPFISYVYDNAQSILQGALDCAEACGHGDADGMKQMLDCLVLEVQLCNLIGHSRPEEGSEHYFAYSVENIMGKGLPHGDLVGPGIVLAAALQGQDIKPLVKALKDCRIPLKSIPDSAIQETLHQLRDYSIKHSLPYGIAHAVNAEQVHNLPSIHDLVG